jgi:hypothetical protein
MTEAILCIALAGLGQPTTSEPESRGSATWTEFYLDAAKQYQVTGSSDGKTVPLNDRAVFDWTSISDFNGAVFTWTQNGRPALVTTIFSFPVTNSKQRQAVHEFASFAEDELTVVGPDNREWVAPKLKTLQPVPGASPPPGSANPFKLQCRRIAKDFSAHLNRRGERWDLRLLPTPLVEYRQPSDEVLGGGLFAFVGYSTDPEILLLIEARKSADGPTWYYQPIRFSDKSLYLSFKDKPAWESLRIGHGSDGPDSEDPHYQVLTSERLAADVVERLSAAAAKESE